MYKRNIRASSRNHHRRERVLLDIPSVCLYPWVPSMALQYFSILLFERQDFRVVDHKMCFDILYNSEKYRILKRIQW